ncbi:MAG TPA: L-threonylcarbamoyladenylate synthase [Verrucomicrobiota bacterium]|nr:L-threonylcarbamoyladenylate synthase [Verrucomicrobiota bacterium]
MAAEVLPTHTPALMAEAVERAAAALRAGEVVAVPTETVYGLAANALDPAAVAKIFALKGRPAHNPIIVHVASAAMARPCVAHWPALADALGAAFWPGPLTLVMAKSKEIPDLVTAGGETVGIRWPQHPFMQAVIRACGFPLAAPSANLANRLSPTNASHVQEQLGDRLRLIVDGGECAVGIESTVVDVTGSAPVVLRPGMITEPAILRAAAATDFQSTNPRLSYPSSAVLRSPGQLVRHYSPRAKLVVWTWTDEADLGRQLSLSGARPETTFLLTHTRIPMSGRLPHVMLIPDDPEAFARALYAELHRCDAAGAEMIVVEALPNTSEWAGIADRLRRASA